MKKVILFLLALILCMSVLISCGNNETDKHGDSSITGSVSEEQSMEVPTHEEILEEAGPFGDGYSGDYAD